MSATISLDVGRTNRKAFVYDSAYQCLFQEESGVEETVDEDGYPCEDLQALTEWIHEVLNRILRRKEFNITSINYAAHGASFVNLDVHGKPVTPLYNYLKPYPEQLKARFYTSFGGEAHFSQVTASPVLGSLNAGMQLYRLKHERPQLFSRIHRSLFLPQYIAFVVTGQQATDITSVGCHTNLWDFRNMQYHQWVAQEGIDRVLAPLLPSNTIWKTHFAGKSLVSGIGLHDSSAAMVPYLHHHTGPFALLSTGTWSITMNPFNPTPLSAEELSADCLCYLRYDQKPLKASRLFSGPLHQKILDDIVTHFGCSPDFHKSMKYDPAQLAGTKEWNRCSTPAQAYHQRMKGLAEFQRAASLRVLNRDVKTLFVDGGFSRNPVFMGLLSLMLPEMEIRIAPIDQASAWGAAMMVQGPPV